MAYLAMITSPCFVFAAQPSALESRFHAKRYFPTGISPNPSGFFLLDFTKRLQYSDENLKTSYKESSLKKGVKEQ